VPDRVNETPRDTSYEWVIILPSGNLRTGRGMVFSGNPFRGRGRHKCD